MLIDSSLPGDHAGVPLAVHPSPEIHSPAYLPLTTSVLLSATKEQLKSQLGYALRLGDIITNVVENNDNFKLSSEGEYVASMAPCLVGSLRAISELLEVESLQCESTLKKKDALIECLRQEILQLKALKFDEHRLAQSAFHQCLSPAPSISPITPTRAWAAEPPTKERHRAIHRQPSSAVTNSSRAAEHIKTNHNANAPKQAESAPATPSSPHSSASSRKSVKSESLPNSKTHKGKKHTPKKRMLQNFTASANKANSSSATKPSNAHVVVIEPNHIDSVLDSPQTFSLLKESVDYKSLRAIKGKKFISKKRVVISCDSNEACQSFCSSIASNDQLTARIPIKKKPQVQLLDIESGVDNDKILGLLKSKNSGFEDFSSDDFKIKFHRENGNGSKYVVAEVNPKLFQTLMQLHKVHINSVSSSLITVRKRIRVTRCFKCQLYGHRQSECRNAAICARCSGSHDTRKCTESHAKCANCTRTNDKRAHSHKPPINNCHRADDPSCPRYHQIQRIVEGKIDFGLDPVPMDIEPDTFFTPATSFSSIDLILNDFHPHPDTNCHTPNCIHNILFSHDTASSLLPTNPGV